MSVEPTLPAPLMLACLAPSVVILGALAIVEVRKWYRVRLARRK
jgi:hypothetical protein